MVFLKTQYDQFHTKINELSKKPFVGLLRKAGASYINKKAIFFFRDLNYHVFINMNVFSYHESGNYV